LLAVTIDSAVPDGATHIDGSHSAPLSSVDSPASPTIDAATEWALAARGGDPVAAAAFVRATQAEVWRFVASLVDAGAAGDLTQDTYLRAFRALPAFEGRATARTWLFGIARRTCADYIRSAVRRRQLLTRVAELDVVEPAHEDPSGSVGASELLRRLNTSQREAFVLTQVLGLSYEEAAQSLGVPIGTIRSRVARARAELVAALARAWAV
jgi:RNA polymerase sigma-70 factor, ECF subfamily